MSTESLFELDGDCILVMILCFNVFIDITDALSVFSLLNTDQEKYCIYFDQPLCLVTDQE